MFRPRLIVATLALLCLSTVLASPAMAHPGTPGHEFVDGLEHPIFGLDHLLAMVAVGLLAVRIGGRGSVGDAGGIFGEHARRRPGCRGWLAAARSGIRNSGVGAGPGRADRRHGSLRYLSRPDWWRCSLSFTVTPTTAELVSGGSLGAYAGGFLLTTALTERCWRGGRTGAVCVGQSAGYRALVVAPRWRGHHGCRRAAGHRRSLTRKFCSSTRLDCARSLVHLAARCYRERISSRRYRLWMNEALSFCT